MEQERVDQQKSQPPSLETPQPVTPQPQTQQPAAAPKKTKFPTFLIALIVFLLLVGGAAFAYFKKIGPFASLTLPSEKKEEIASPQKQVEEEKTEAEAQEGKPPATTTVSKYEKDSDADSIPDFIEGKVGTDPTIDDCALEVGCGKTAGVKPKPVNIFFIFDSSGSMAGQVTGGRKIDIAKKAMKRYIDGLSVKINSGLMVYGHKGNNTASGKAVSCAGIETLYPLGKVDKEDFKLKIDSFEPTGWTPIADSFDKTQAEFSGKEEEVNRLVLVSDGIETCGGDPCSVAKQLKQTGINPIIDVVGFDVDETARTQLSCIAQVTGGQYFDVHTAEEFDDVFEKLGENAEDLAQSSGCLSDNEAEYLDCLVDRFEKVLDYITERMSAADIETEEKLELVRVQQKLNEKFQETTMETSEQTTTDIDKLLEEYGVPSLPPIPSP